MEKHHITWTEFDSLCAELQNQIKVYESANAMQFDCIIGLLRGGAIPAVWLAHNLNLPLRMVGLHTREKDGTMKYIAEFYNDIKHELNNFVYEKNVLIVDDICDTGRTVSMLMDYMKDLNCKQCQFATLHRAPDSYYKPSFYAAVNSMWVVYPWEA